MDDWDTVTKIGSKVGGRGGGGPRETTIKSRSALNRAQREGNVISTVKKYSSANSAGSGSGQRLTMVDRADGPVKLKKVPRELGAQIVKARNEQNLSHLELAKKANLDKGIVKDWEMCLADFNEVDFNKIQNALGVFLLGVDKGKEMPKKKEPKWKQAAAAKEAAAKEKAAKEKAAKEAPEKEAAMAAEREAAEKEAAERAAGEDNPNTPSIQSPSIKSPSVQSPSVKSPSTGSPSIKSLSIKSPPIA